MRGVIRVCCVGMIFLELITAADGGRGRNGAGGYAIDYLMIFAEGFIVMGPGTTVCVKFILEMMGGPVTTTPDVEYGPEALDMARGLKGFMVTTKIL